MYMLVSFALARSHCAARGARTLPINSWKTVDRRFSSTARSHRAFSSSSRASQAHATPNPIPAAFLRGGTSKGVFINAKHLPSDRNEWDSIFLGIMGSPDAQYGRQLNGMGGGVSSLSKICVVGPASDEHRSLGADAQYTFCQVGIRNETLDYSGNCGNLSTMIAPFALDEGLCALPSSDRGSLHVYNTNTSKVIQCTFPLTDDPSGRPVADLDRAQVHIAGVPGKASRIDLSFLSPGGAATGKLLPSGKPTDWLSTIINGARRTLKVSLVDATNPTVFVSAAELARVSGLADVRHADAHDYADAQLLKTLDRIRRAGAEKMGLDPRLKAQPKIAVVSAPFQASNQDDVDIVARALSMEVLHQAIPMTVGLCLGVAAEIHGTVVNAFIRGRREQRPIRIGHPSGFVDVASEFDSEGRISKATVVRTGRRLMRGEVFW